ncbi:hypothetical protein HRI_004911400 [Hibiscus trionum]|uniref:Uncharacterized protein n=1 Tax=Hibiscus trionum TaxID=183268 RepID=A0A9W7JG05_HIBTR|nr:hypothetical protein HRI_004911400 [Hibiscus trionum]
MLKSDTPSKMFLVVRFCLYGFDIVNEHKISRYCFSISLLSAPYVMLEIKKRGGKSKEKQFKNEETNQKGWNDAVSINATRQTGPSQETADSTQAAEVG